MTTEYTKEYRRRNPIIPPAEPKGPIPERVRLEMLYGQRHGALRALEKAGKVTFDAVCDCWRSYSGACLPVYALCDDVAFTTFMLGAQ